MMSSFEALLLIRVLVYFLFGKVQMVFQSAILTMFIITKTQDEMPQKSKMELIELIG